MCFLCLDFDDVIINSGVIVGRQLARIDYKAGEEYINKVIAMKISGAIDDKTFDALYHEHLMIKDSILEETSSKYRGLIDYGEIYDQSNLYLDVVKNIRKLSESGLYEKIYCVSHYNVDREVNYKLSLIFRYFPYIKFIPVKFHQIPYQNGVSRNKTDKASYVKFILNLTDFSQYVLIDDSLNNVTKWIDAGGIGIRFRNSINTRESYLETVDENYVIRVLGNLKPEIVNQAIEEEVRVKKLSLF